MRRAMQGKELDLVVGLDHEKPIEKDGAEIMLWELEKCYKKESRIHKLGKLKEFYNKEGSRGEYGRLCKEI